MIFAIYRSARRRSLPENPQEHYSRHQRSICKWQTKIGIPRRLRQTDFYPFDNTSSKFSSLFRSFQSKRSQKTHFPAESSNLAIPSKQASDSRRVVSKKRIRIYNESKRRNFKKFKLEIRGLKQIDDRMNLGFANRWI